MTIKHNPTILAAVLLISLTMFSGCEDPKPDGFPDIYPVSITVKQDGAPLSEASVTLYPVGGGKNWAIGGMTGGNGVAKLRTYGKFDGAPLGKFKVVVSKEISEGGAAAPQVDGDAPAPKSTLKVFSLIEEKFNSPETTPLEIEITTSAKSFELDAGKAVKEPRATAD